MPGVVPPGLLLAGGWQRGRFLGKHCPPVLLLLPCRLLPTLPLLLAGLMSDRPCAGLALCSAGLQPCALNTILGRGLGLKV